jgi:hypothetical protein
MESATSRKPGNLPVGLVARFLRGKGMTGTICPVVSPRFEEPGFFSEIPFSSYPMTCRFKRIVEL